MELEEHRWSDALEWRRRHEVEERGGGGGEGARGREGGPVCDGSAYTALLICPLIGSKEHHQVAQSRDNRTQT